MQKAYGSTFDISRPGFIEGRGEPRVRAYRNSATSLADIWTIGIPATVDNSAAYRVTWGSLYAETVTDGSATRAELQSALLNEIRNSELFGPWVPSVSGNNIVMTSRYPGIPQTLSVNTNTTNDLTLTHTVTASTSSSIPFGRFVARKAGDAEEDARLPSATTDRLIGASLSTWAVEKDSIGPNAKALYPPDEMMDILDRCNDIDGMWFEALDLNITIDDTVYCSVDGANGGKATRSSTDTIAVSNARFVGSTKVTADGVPMVLISFNFA